MSRKREHPTRRKSSTNQNNECDYLTDLVDRNSNGGILISDDEIKAAFDFFDIKGSGKVTVSNLKERLEALTKKVTKIEIRSILDGKDYITLQDIKDIVKDNDVSIDPFKEAFAILDPTGKGFISEERLKKIFSNLGYGELTEEELQLLISTGDADKDGQIGLSDFMALGISRNSGLKPDDT